jgi:uroporphyrinogen-III synthase
LSSEPLAGRHILVTRPREQAAGLAVLIHAAGGEALLYPTIEIAPPQDRAALERVIAELASYDLAIFVSPTAVREGLKHVARWPAGLRAAAVGPGTKAELERRGVQQVLAPACGADSEALLREHALGALDGRRALIFRGEGGRESLADGLVARGAKVSYAECYRRARPRADFSSLATRWQSGGVDAVTAFSATAVSNLVELLPLSARELLSGTPLFATHPRIAQAAARLGARNVTLAGPGKSEMLAGLVAYFGRGK